MSVCRHGYSPAEKCRACAEARAVFERLATPCCAYVARDQHWPVSWNPFNRVVQCHNCGTVYEPKEASLKSIEIQGVHLAHIGGRCEVSVQTMDGVWRTCISEPASAFQPGENGSPISHIVEPSGMANSPPRGI